MADIFNEANFKYNTMHYQICEIFRLKKSLYSKNYDCGKIISIMGLLKVSKPVKENLIFTFPWIHFSKLLAILNFAYKKVSV